MPGVIEHFSNDEMGIGLCSGIRIAPNSHTVIHQQVSLSYSIDQFTIIQLFDFSRFSSDVEYARQMKTSIGEMINLKNVTVFCEFSPLPVNPKYQFLNSRHLRKNTNGGGDATRVFVWAVVSPPLQAVEAKEVGAQALYYDFLK